MSSPVHNDLDKRSMYAPPWAREAQQQTPESIIEAIEQLRQERAQAAALAAEQQAAAAEAEPPRRLRDRSQRELPLSRSTDPTDIETAMADAVRASWTPHSLDPVTMPEPPKPRLSAPSVGMVVRLGGAVVVAAGVALVMTGIVPLPQVGIGSWLGLDDGSSKTGQVASLRSTRAAPTAPPVVAADPPAKVSLAVATLPPAAPMPVAVAAPPPAPAAPPVVAMPVKTTPVTPPLPADVLSAFASIEPASAPRAMKSDAVPVVAPVPRLPELRAIERDEVASLIKRGELLLLEGDVSSARLLLRRAAESGDPNATLILAGTYDRSELARLKVIGIAPDDAQARHWYTKAVEYGSAEAVRRLQQFAQR